MKQEQAENLTTQYLKPIYGFALKRCASLQDAEDLTQEIALKVFQSLLCRKDLETPDKFIWTVAHNALANYYRGKVKTTLGVPIGELAKLLPSEDDPESNLMKKEAVRRLHREIAYLSKLQRRIVIAYYFENKKQEAIAAELGIPVGTVKWHLFEAKKDLKKGMDTMRQASELKFNPIKFEICGTIGSPGTNGDNRNFFRSALSQNIVYCVWERAKTAVQIADDLGVSPVYVESEAEYLAEYGFLTEQGGKYLCNILLDELDDDLTAIKDGMYTKAAKLIANELFDALTGSGILHDTRILCSQGDDNFLLWSLIPYLAALSGEKLMDQSISFDAVATIRPDGGHNLCCASVAAPNVKKPAYSESMQYFCGPCWNGNQKYTLWQVDSEWSAKRVNDRYIDTADRILSLVSRAAIGTLSEDEYAFLAENGILKTSGACGGNFQAAWEIVRFENAEIKKELLAIGERVKDNHWAQLEAMKEPYTGALLSRTPKHLRKMREYTLQSLFFSDNWFLLHCMKELVGSGKLKMPTQGQKQSLSTILIPNA